MSATVIFRQRCRSLYPVHRQLQIFSCPVVWLVCLPIMGQTQKMAHRISRIDRDGYVSRSGGVDKMIAILAVLAMIPILMPYWWLLALDTFGWIQNRLGQVEVNQKWLLLRVNETQWTLVNMQSGLTWTIYSRLLSDCVSVRSQAGIGRSAGNAIG